MNEEEDLAPEPKKADTGGSPFAVAIFLCMLLVAVGLRVKQAYDLRKSVLAEAAVRGRTFTVEVAETPEKRELGLGNRKELAADRGMYFPFQTAARWVFWMKRMHFPIDIVWLREGKVVDIHRNVPVPVSENLETYSPVEPADAVLELNAGQAEAMGLQPGDELKIRAL